MTDATAPQASLFRSVWANPILLLVLTIVLSRIYIRVFYREIE